MVGVQTSLGLIRNAASSALENLETERNSISLSLCAGALALGLEGVVAKDARSHTSKVPLKISFG